MSDRARRYRNFKVASKIAGDRPHSMEGVDRYMTMVAWPEILDAYADEIAAAMERGETSITIDTQEFI